LLLLLLQLKKVKKDLVNTTVKNYLQEQSTITINHLYYLERKLRPDSVMNLPILFGRTKNIQIFLEKVENV